MLEKLETRNEDIEEVKNIVNLLILIRLKCREKKASGKR
jgi:hypothetical protein